MLYFTAGAIRQGAKSHLGSLSHERLDQMISRGPLQPGMLYDCVKTEVHRYECMKQWRMAN